MKATKQPCKIKTPWQLHGIGLNKSREHTEKEGRENKSFCVAETHADEDPRRLSHHHEAGMQGWEVAKTSVGEAGGGGGGCSY